MLMLAQVFAGLAALVHVYIFVLESFAWNTPRGRATFATTPEQAASSADLAYNQGFYNLFLAVICATGIVMLALGVTGPGAALVFAGAGSMVLAAVVLLTRNRAMARAAMVQGVAPLIAVGALAVALVG
jgi:putative membrane protein